MCTYLFAAHLWLFLTGIIEQRVACLWPLAASPVLLVT